MGFKKFRWEVPKKSSYLALTFEWSYRYKDKKPHFEISVKLCIFEPHIDLLKKKFFTLFSDFGFKKTHFRIGRHENKEKTHFLL
jgi:hypothetical protein